MLRIGITQRVQDLSDRGERRDCLDQAWTSLLYELEMIAVPLPNTFSNVAHLISALGLDGIVLSGGNDLGHLPSPANPAPERDRFEKELLHECERRRIPVLGVCRGMQKLVVHHGGAVEPIEGHVGVRHGLKVISADSLPLEPREEVNSFHDYGVVSIDRLGPQLRPVAVAFDGSVEAVAHRALPQWGIMWHPERAPKDPRDAALIKTFFSLRHDT